MEHFTLSNFKKAGHLAFLTGFIFVLSSCGGGGGSGGGGTQPVTYTYKSFSEIDASTQAFVDACEANSSTCTESNAAAFLQEIIDSTSYHLAAHHVRDTTGGNNFCSYDSTSASYAISLDGENVKYTYSYGAQVGATSKYGSVCTGADVSGRTYSANEENISDSVTYSFPGALSGIIDLDYKLWGFTDSSLNEIVLTTTEVSQKENSGVYWSGNQYVIGEVGNTDYGTSCNYFVNPKVCYRVTSDTTRNTDLLAINAGFKTFSGDMPSSGLASYRSFAMSSGIFGFTDFMNFGIGGAFVSSGCSQTNPSHASCHWSVQNSVSAEQFISVDYSSRTVSGTISMQNHYFETSYGNMVLIENADYDSFKDTLKNLVISATISGNSFSGTVSNGHYSGNITGYFYGPQAKEIGAILRFESEGVSGSHFSASGAAVVMILNGRK